MLVIGGMGSVSGSIIGAVAISGLAEGLRRVEDATLLYGLSQIMLAVIFIVVIIVRREGLLGQREIPLDRLFAGERWRLVSKRRRPPALAGRSEPVDPSELRHSIRSAQSIAVVSSRAPSAMCSSITLASARRPIRAPIQYSSGTSDASVLNRSLLAGASQQLAVVSVASPAANRIDLAHVGVDIGNMAAR